jgi:uncharacterized HhH-GPD family protein
MCRSEVSGRLPIRPVTDADSAFAFVLGVLFNQQVKADAAWRAPWVLADRIGGVAPEPLLAIPYPEFASKFAEAPAVHPFKEIMAQRAYEAADTVACTYHGDARNIWAGRTATEFLDRLQRIRGIGHHKAVMALFVATRELNIAIRDDGGRYSIDECASLAQRFHPHREPLLTML